MAALLYTAARIAPVGIAAMLGAIPAATASAPPPAVALFYGKAAPLVELKAFDIVVVEPAHGYDPRAHAAASAGASRLYAYLSLGELGPEKRRAPAVRKAWRLADNPVWKSLIVDQTAAGWRDFVLDQLVAPLAAAGYQGLFLDTLDAFAAVPGVDADAQRRAMAATIRAIRARFPQLSLIANRGFEMLPAIHDTLEMVAAESLFRGWDEARQAYFEVPAADREWLLARLAEVRSRYRLPTLAIDYLDPADRPAMRELAAAIAATGAVPWVADGRLAALGLGRVEVLPRRVLVLYDGADYRLESETPAARYAAMPLQHLGLIPDYHDLRQPLPDHPQAGRLAGILLWPAGPLPQAEALADWLSRRRHEGVPIVFLGQFGLAAEALARRFGLRWQAGSDWRISGQWPPLGFEAQPSLPPVLAGHWQPLAGEAVAPLLELSTANGRRAVPVAYTEWGGYCLDPFLIAELPGTGQRRWLLDPFAFFAQALRLPAMPIPDTTTENGRRILLTHIDGDGYPSRAELPGNPPAGEVLHERILSRYRVPTTLSLIEAETAPHGLHAADSPRLEAAARASFRLPHVEPATHTFSHPFDWLAAVGGTPGTPGEFYLAVPGYRFDLAREITGSAAYVATLAPADKPVRLVFWSGAAEPPAKAIALADAAGLKNLNGGHTTISRDRPTLTAVSALGVHKSGRWQTYAPVMNENLYTNLWTGPFWGYRRVIETFELTDAPRRIKPINIYYHSYSASKTASLAALATVYDWALAQRPTPLFASEYVALAEDFNTLAIAREGDAFRVRGHGALRTLRLPASLPPPDPLASDGVAGHAAGAEGRYVHLAAPAAVLRPAVRRPARSAGTWLVEANRRLDGWRREGARVDFSLAGFGAAEFALAGASTCSAGGRTLEPQAAPPGVLRFRIDDAPRTLALSCR